MLQPGGGGAVGRSVACGSRCRAGSIPIWRGLRGSVIVDGRRGLPVFTVLFALYVKVQFTRNDGRRRSGAPCVQWRHEKWPVKHLSTRVLHTMNGAPQRAMRPRSASTALRPLTPQVFTLNLAVRRDQGAPVNGLPCRWAATKCRYHGPRLVSPGPVRPAAVRRRRPPFVGGPRCRVAACETRVEVAGIAALLALPDLDGAGWTGIGV